MGMEATRNLPKFYPKRSKLLEAALGYAARGWPVFPCEAGGKKPLTPNGFKDATTDPRIVTAWWNRFPDANIAAPTGERSGFFVLDIDRDSWGFGTLDALEGQFGVLPRTRTVRTGRGGLHLYFKYPDDGTVIPNSAGRLGLGIDVRGEGGYVLVPPSETEGAYEYLD
jgi:Bifunctional DNA primase/polymerase, N-terminal